MKTRASSFLLAAGLLFGAAILAPAVGNAATPPDLTGYLRDMVRPPTPYVDARLLTAGSAKTVTVATFAGKNPLSYRVVVIFTADCPNYYVKISGTAAEPTGDVSDGSASERNPGALQFGQGDTFSIETPTDCKVTFPEYPVRY